MAITTERSGEALIAKTEGRVDGSNAREFQSELESVISADDRAVVLDLADLTYISSAGLRVILLVTKSLRDRNARFAVCNLSESIREVFSISGFDQIIPVHADQSAAIASFG